ncbi:MAG: L-fucose mutarotase [Candidatus Ordinivivax streblomastigis]|uniref:L-fucose mutarotase n=1 Tax=Candidatus Ordinivivax streblomastigis TaxID=2540710 RepID=A0A5M8NZB2_9BACT|nr:MAG: L-fucose mutarotase [Candidatus Ordinivivax streblomastigis]
MNTKNTGYKRQEYTVPVKRYCQTLHLKNDPVLIEEYIRIHSEQYSWPAIREGIRSIGILEMEIFHIGNQLFMIVETPLDFNWEEAFEQLAQLPRQQEWEEFVARFQLSDPKASSAEKWQLMDRIFYLYK